MNSFQLKLTAVITMLIDHIGAILFPQHLFLRCIGRLAFPIYCYLLIEGFNHTRSLRSYMLRLGGFALLSEIPYDLAFRGEWIYQEKQNVFFTLLIGLAVVAVCSHIGRNGKVAVGGRLMQAGALLAGCILASWVRCDYTYTGVLLIFLFYLFHDSKWQSAAALIVLMAIEHYSGSVQWMASFAAVFILLYNGRKGPSLKYGFYLFYPVHLMVLYLIGY